MGKKCIEKNTCSSKKKLCAEDPHKSRADKSVQRNGYDHRNQERKIKIFGKNTRIKNCEKIFKNIPEGTSLLGSKDTGSRLQTFTVQ
jgi:hypothetical protein